MTGQASCTKGSKAAQEYLAQPEKVQYQEHNNFSARDLTPGERYEEMSAVAKLNERVQRPNVSGVLSPAPEIAKDLTFDQWREMAWEYAEKVGFQDNQWGWYTHEDTGKVHLHIYANRIDFAGRCTVENANIGERTGRIADQMSEDRGWKKAVEYTMERKQNFHQLLLTAAKGSSSLEEVKKKMADSGVVLELNYNTKNGQQNLNGARMWLLEEQEMRKRLEAEGKLSERQRNTRLGFTLSDCAKAVPKPERLKISDLNEIVNQNKIQNGRKQTTFADGDIGGDPEIRRGFKR